MTVEYVRTDRFAAVVEAAALALVDFTADWCPPCRALAPHLEALAVEMSGQIVVAKVDVDREPGLAARFGVQSMPTLIFFRHGREIDRLVGLRPIGHLRALVTELSAT